MVCHCAGQVLTAGKVQYQNQPLMHNYLLIKPEPNQTLSFRAPELTPGLEVNHTGSESVFLCFWKLLQQLLCFCTFRHVSSGAVWLIHLVVIKWEHFMGPFTSSYDILSCYPQCSVVHFHSATRELRHWGASVICRPDVTGLKVTLLSFIIKQHCSWLALSLKDTELTQCKESNRRLWNIHMEV